VTFATACARFALLPKYLIITPYRHALVLDGLQQYPLTGPPSLSGVYERRSKIPSLQWCTLVSKEKTFPTDTINDPLNLVAKFSYYLKKKTFPTDTMNRSMLPLAADCCFGWRRGGAGEGWRGRYGTSEYVCV
jgi:hypothetical protein